MDSHWDKVYTSKAISNVSWYEPNPALSLQLIRSCGVGLTERVIDVGAGASFLVDELLNAGYTNLTVLDVSREVLARVRERLGARAASVHFVCANITEFEPKQRYALWHDRAVFHFLIEKADRDRYIDVLRRALRPDGHLIMATFGPDGPTQCSGLPTARYDARSLCAELGADFELVESTLSVHVTPFNTRQQFLYARFVRRAGH